MWVQLGRHSDPPRNANSATDPPLLHICVFLRTLFCLMWRNQLLNKNEPVDLMNDGIIMCLGYSNALKTLKNMIVLSIFAFHWHRICVLYLSVCIFGLSHFRMQVTQCGRPSYALIWTFWIPLPTFRHTETFCHLLTCCPHSPPGLKIRTCTNVTSVTHLQTQTSKF